MMSQPLSTALAASSDFAAAASAYAAVMSIHVALELSLTTIKHSRLTEGEAGQRTSTPMAPACAKGLVLCQ